MGADALWPALVRYKWGETVGNLVGQGVGAIITLILTLIVGKVIRGFGKTDPGYSELGVDDAKVLSLVTLGVGLIFVAWLLVAMARNIPVLTAPEAAVIHDLLSRAAR